MDSARCPLYLNPFYGTNKAAASFLLGVSIRNPNAVNNDRKERLPNLHFPTVHTNVRGSHPPVHLSHNSAIFNSNRDWSLFPSTYFRERLPASILSSFNVFTNFTHFLELCTVVIKTCSYMMSPSSRGRSQLGLMIT